MDIGAYNLSQFLIDGKHALTSKFGFTCCNENNINSMVVFAMQVTFTSLLFIYSFSKYIKYMTFNKTNTVRYNSCFCCLNNK